MAAWPGENDLAEYLGQGRLADPARLAQYRESVAAAIDSLWADLDEAKMPDQTGPLDERCPDAVRRAALMYAARLHRRSDSINGVIATGDVALRVSGNDPDVMKLIRRYAVGPEA